MAILALHACIMLQLHMVLLLLGSAIKRRWGGRGRLFLEAGSAPACQESMTAATWARHSSRLRTAQREHSQRQATVLRSVAALACMQLRVHGASRARSHAFWMERQASAAATHERTGACMVVPCRCGCDSDYTAINNGFIQQWSPCATLLLVGAWQRKAALWCCAC